MSGSPDDLEVRAYLALQGMGGASGKLADWRTDVASVLRSPAPLSEEFREVLAKAIEGDLHGFSLVLAADAGEKKRRQDHFGGVRSRQEWMAIGGALAARIEAGDSRTVAIDWGADEFRSSREKCDASLVYFERARRWMKRARSRQPNAFKQLDDEMLLLIFHQADAKGKAVD